MSTEIQVTDNLINTIKETYRGEIVQTGSGDEYSTRPLVPLPIATVQPETIVRCIGVNTLDGVVDYIRENVDKIAPDNMILHIASEDTVNLMSAVFGKSKAREVFIQAHVQSLFDDNFEFDEYQPVEDFLIGLKTLFVQTSGIEKITSIVGNIIEDNIRMTSDDGVTQTVEVKRGIRRAEVEIANPYLLKPYRTFREVDQPESAFILRLRAGSPPYCALFEADGGAWKLAAMKNIKQYLEEQEIAVPIIC